jgi:hypothetical protein
MCPGSLARKTLIPRIGSSLSPRITAATLSTRFPPAGKASQLKWHSGYSKNSISARSLGFRREPPPADRGSEARVRRHLRVRVRRRYNAEAATRPTMRFVELKSEEQLDMQTLHRARDRLVGERTALINQLRAILLERGITVAQGRRQLERHLAGLSALGGSAKDCVCSSKTCGGNGANWTGALRNSTKSLPNGHAAKRRRVAS